MITISKLGGSVVVDTGNRSQYLTLTNPSRSIIYDESNNTIDISIGDFHKNDLPLDQITIAGVVPTNKSEFDTQIALVFLDTDSGNGGSGTVTTDATLTGDGSSGTPLSVVNALTIDEENLWNDAALLAAGGTNRVVSGNTIWNTGLTFDIVGTIYSNLVYYILGTRYEADPTQVTLSTADTSNARIDVIYFDTSGNVGVLEGTPSADPVKPVVDSDTQVELTHVTVPANATEPVISGNLTVYDENTEFTGASTNGTVNFAATTAPSSGTKHISCGAFTNNQNINLTDGSLHDASTFQNLTFKLRLNATFTNNTYLSFYFANGTNPVSNQVAVTTGTFGYSRTVTGSYQVVSIPMSAFVFTNTQFNRIYIVLHGTNATGFYLDAITLQGGVTIPASNGVQSFNSRTGNIIPQSGDYNISQITNGLSNALTSARLFIGNGSNVATGVAASQDATVDNTGAFTVTGLKTKALPTLSAGYLRYSGSAFAFVNPDTVVNVLDYGADSTGATDSTAAFNSAIAVAVTTGKDLYIPKSYPNKYKVTTSALKAGSQTNKRGIELASGLRIFGDGIGKTIITTSNNTTGSISDTNWYPIFNGHTTSVSNVIIHDLEIDGNRSNQAIYDANPYTNPTGHDDLTLHKSIQGIFFYQGDDNHIYNVKSSLCQGFGAEYYNSTNAHIVNSYFDQNGNGGVGFTEVTATGIIDSSTCTNNNSDNIRIIHSGPVTVSNCELSWSGTNALADNWFAGVYVFNSVNCIIENCLVHDNSAYGIDIATDDAATYERAVIRDNYIYQNGNGGIVTGSTNKLLISGNHIYKNGKKSNGATDTRSNYNPAAIVGNNSSDCIITNNTVWEDAQNVQIYFIKKWGGTPTPSYSFSKSIIQNNKVKWIADLSHAYNGENGDNVIFGNSIYNSSGTIVNPGSDAQILTLSGGRPVWAVNNASPSIPLTHFGFNHMFLFEPSINSTTPSVMGLISPTISGTATARVLSTTSYLAQSRRIGYVSSATAGNVAGIRRSDGQFWRGNAAGLGGFYFRLLFGVPATTSDTIFFAGINFAGTALAATTEISTLVNLIGVGKDSTDTNFQIFYNDGSGTATKEDTGIAISNTAVYAITISCSANGSTMTVTFQDVGAATSYSTSPGTNLPANNIVLCYLVNMSNNATASAVAVDIISMYGESY